MITPLELAKKYIGYTEHPANSNQTLFGAWYGMNGVPWCMEFVQFLFAQCDCPLPYKTASCSALLDWYKAYQPNKIKIMPLPNDIVIYKFGHTGIVESGNSQAVTAIEGNTSPTVTGSQDNGGGVYRRTRTADSVAAYIRAFDFTEKPKEVTEVRYNTYEEMPSWAKPTIRKLIEKGYLQGNGTVKDAYGFPADLNLSLDMIRIFVINDRAGIYG